LEFLGLVNISDRYIELKNGDYLTFFRVLPKNIAVMPAQEIRKEIESLSAMLSLAKDDLEFIAIPSYENYDDITMYYQKQRDHFREHDGNDIRAKLLESDIRYLSEINATRSGAKEFYIMLRLPISKRKEMDVTVKSCEKLINEAGFSPRVACGNELFDIVQIYLENFRA
jgi:hypothetical protein